MLGDEKWDEAWNTHKCNLDNGDCNFWGDENAEPNGWTYEKLNDNNWDELECYN